MTTIHRIRKQYSKPFRQVVSDLAPTMCRAEIARHLGISKSYFYKICKVYNLDYQFTEVPPTVKRIQSEFEESFADVIKGFAIMGYSKRATASILEISLCNFRRLLKLYAPNAPWKKQINMRDECKAKSPGWPKGKPRTPHYTHSISELLSYRQQYSGLTSHQFDNLAPVSSSTIRRRLGWFR